MRFHSNKLLFQAAIYVNSNLLPFKLKFHSGLNLGCSYLISEMSFEFISFEEKLQCECNTEQKWMFVCYCRSCTPIMYSIVDDGLEWIYMIRTNNVSPIKILLCVYSVNSC